MSKCVPQLFLGSLPRTRQSAIRYFHISHNASPPHRHTQILHNLCFSFLLVTTAVPREIENNAYAIFFWGGGGGGVRRGDTVHFGKCGSGVFAIYFPVPCVTVPVPFSLLKWRKAKIAFRDTCISRQAEPHVSVRLKLKHGSRRTNNWSDRNAPITDYESS